MKRVVYRARYNTKNIFNEGFICISKKGEDYDIEGVFGLDYVKIHFISKYTFDLILYENSIYLKDGYLFTTIQKTIFKSQNLFVPNIMCPESYLLTSKTSYMNLMLINEVESGIDDILNDLKNVRI